MIHKPAESVSPALRWMRAGLRSLSRISPELAARLALEIFLTPLGQPKVTRGQPVLDIAIHLKISFEDKQLTGYQWGDGSQTVLLVHGWRASAGSMSAFVEPLTACGFRVVAFDAPAHRKSPGRQLDLIRYSDAIRAVLHQFEPIQGIVAHSMGASAATLALVKMARIPIERLVLVSVPQSLKGSVHGFAALLGLDEQTKAAFFALLEKRYGGAISAFNMVDAVTELEIAGLVVHDRDDGIVPFADGEAIATAWEEGSFLVTEGLGHNNLLRDAETVTEVCDFLC